MERSWRERDGGARCCVRGQKSTQRDKAIAPLPAVVDITSGCFLAPKLRAQAGGGALPPTQSHANHWQGWGPGSLRHLSKCPKDESCRWFLFGKRQGTQGGERVCARPKLLEDFCRWLLLSSHSLLFHRNFAWNYFGEGHRGLVYTIFLKIIYIKKL